MPRHNRHRSGFMAGYKVKSCGKAHPWCRKCRPDIVTNHMPGVLAMANGWRGRHPGRALHKSGCGCAFCDPAVNAEASRRRWADPEYAARVRPKTLRTRRPNGPERRMAAVLGDQFRYVGDGSLVIAGMSPDFVHREQPLVVEVFGDYWHRGEDPAARIARFEAAGWACAVFWERELVPNVG